MMQRRLFIANGQNLVYILNRKFNSEDISYDYDLISGLCMNSCKNYGKAGGCPPKAPKYECIKKDYPFSVLIYAKLLSKFKSIKVRKSNSYYIHYRSQDVILSNLLTKLGYQIKVAFGSNIVFLNNGYCMGCGNKKCNYKIGNESCKNPEKRTYSLEATGINVTTTVKELFEIDLQWYNNKNCHEIEYMCKVIGIFCEDRPTQNDILNSMICNLNKLPSTKFHINSHDFDVRLDGLLNSKK